MNIEKHLNLKERQVMSVATLMISCLLMVSSCSQGNQVNRDEKVIFSTIDNKELTIDKMLNGGQQVHRVKISQSIGINSSANTTKWDLSLGKRDIKQAVIVYDEIGLQKSIRFTKIGEYQVRLGSHQSGRQMNIMMHSLTIVVVD